MSGFSGMSGMSGLSGFSGMSGQLLPQGGYLLPQGSVLGFEAGNNLALRLALPKAGSRHALADATFGGEFTVATLDVFRQGCVHLMAEANGHVASRSPCRRRSAVCWDVSLRASFRFFLFCDCKFTKNVSTLQTFQPFS